MDGFEFSYTVKDTGQRVTFPVPDSSHGDNAATGISKKVAQAILKALNKVNEITDVKQVHVIDERNFSRKVVSETGDESPEPEPPPLPGPPEPPPVEPPPEPPVEPPPAEPQPQPQQQPQADSKKSK